MSSVEDRAPGALVDACLRVLCGLGALVLLYSLSRQWAFDRAAEPDLALDAWRYFGGRDQLLALLAVAAAAGAVTGRRAGLYVTLGAGGAALVLLALLAADGLGIGYKLAVLGTLALVAGAAARGLRHRG